MIWLVALIFVGIAALAAGFVMWPILRKAPGSITARALLAASAFLFVLGLGGGLYLYLGKPWLAARTLDGPRVDDLNSLVSALAMHARERPNDLRAWSLLWRSYIRLNDPRDAALAFRHAVGIAPAYMRPDLYALYGGELSSAAGGITEDAEAAFKTALTLDPKNLEARYYLGFDYVSRGEPQKAIVIWQSLLADVPANSRLHGILVDRIAALKATGGAVPDVGAMVASLAARLKSSPDDPEGWQRLVRAYSVIGDKAKAHAALADARIALRAEPQALAQLDAEAKQLKLEK
jgi:cytochrome c-type biogenesis protein CcmH